MRCYLDLGGSVSTVAPPPSHVSGGFKTDSALFLPYSLFLLVRPVHVDVVVNASLSRNSFFIFWLSVAVKIVYFLVHVIDGLGGGGIVETLRG